MTSPQANRVLDELRYMDAGNWDPYDSLAHTNSGIPFHLTEMCSLLFHAGSEDDECSTCNNNGNIDINSSNITTTALATKLQMTAP